MYGLAVLITAVASLLTALACTGISSYLVCHVLASLKLLKSHRLEYLFLPGLHRPDAPVTLCLLLLLVVEVLFFLIFYAIPTALQRALLFLLPLT